MAAEDKEKHKEEEENKRLIKESERRAMRLYDEEEEEANGPSWGYSNWFVLGLIVITAIFVILMIFG